MPAWAGFRYGLLGLALAFLALPLYVTLPEHHARAFGLPLAALGLLLLGARLFDAVIDPLLGRWVDTLFRHGPAQVLNWAWVGAVASSLALAALFFPPTAAQASPMYLLAWCGLCLVLCYVAYSLLTLVHQAWGTRLGDEPEVRTRVVAWREGLAVTGVVAASLLPSWGGVQALVVGYAAAVWCAVFSLAHGPKPLPTPVSLAGGSGLGAGPGQEAAGLTLPWKQAAFRRLLAVYVLNGIASAIPATLVLFFIRDRLQAPQAQGLLLACYFLAGALSVPLWVRLIARWGLVRAWACGMGLAVLSFCWALGLKEGDVTAFAWVCGLSGLALGADLSAPGSLLSGVVARCGHRGHCEGLYWGWWNFATKLNLALAAGLTLPLLQLAGYAPGQASPQGLWALSLTYAALPCLLKAGAALLLWAWLPKTEGDPP
jgi:GPH family glycoside/pentoside/hexuronide:cation symporter